MAEIKEVFLGLNTRLRKFKRQFGVEFQARCEAKTPVRTGEMKRSWGFTEKATDIEVWNFAEHAGFVEYGTERMAPRAPMRRTLLEAEEITAIAIARSKK